MIPYNAHFRQISHHGTLQQTFPIRLPISRLKWIDTGRHQEWGATLRSPNATNANGAFRHARLRRVMRRTILLNVKWPGLWPGTLERRSSWGEQDATVRTQEAQYKYTVVTGYK